MSINSWTEHYHRAGYIFENMLGIYCFVVLFLYREFNPLTTARTNRLACAFFGYNSPAAIARELFKPSTDAQSLLGSIKNKFFFDLGEGFAWEGLGKWGCFWFFDKLWRALEANPIGQNFGLNFFWKLDNLPRW